VKEHLVLNIDLGRLGGSALTDDIDVPKAKSVSDISSEIPLTYVPARNTVVFCPMPWLWQKLKDQMISLSV